MIKVPITYRNFDDEEVTEEHYFHLSKNELLVWVSENQGEDLAQKLERVGKSGDGALIMRTFRDIIARSYGERVDGDSSAFYKDEIKTKRFMSSIAYDQLFENLILDSTAAAAFVNGLMPVGLEKLAAAAEKSARSNSGDIPLPPGSATSTLQDGTVRVHPSPEHKVLYESSGLTEPYDETGELLPWSHREPNQKELTTMTHTQLLDVMARKNKDKNWKPS